MEGMSLLGAALWGQALVGTFDNGCGDKLGRSAGFSEGEELGPDATLGAPDLLLVGLSEQSHFTVKSNQPNCSSPIELAVYSCTKPKVSDPGMLDPVLSTSNSTSRAITSCE